MGTVRERAYITFPVSRKDEDLPQIFKDKYFPDGTGNEKWIDLKPLLMADFGDITLKRKKDTHEQVVVIEMDALSIVNGELKTIQSKSLEDRDLNLNIKNIWIEIISTSAKISKEEIQLCFPNAPKQTVKAVLAQNLTWAQVASTYNLTYYAKDDSYFVKVPDMLNNVVAHVLTSDSDNLTVVYTSSKECREYIEAIPTEIVE